MKPTAKRPRPLTVLLALLALALVGCASWLVSLRCPSSCPQGETVIHVPDACYCVPVPTPSPTPTPTPEGE